VAVITNSITRSNVASQRHSAPQRLGMVATQMRGRSAPLYMLHMRAAGETSMEGMGTIRRWVVLLDAAEAAMADPSRADPCVQRKAGRLLDALFLYEHQMAPRARRRAREYVWRREHPGQALPPTATHRPGELASEGAGERTPEPSTEPCCLCSICRRRWEWCLCRSCRLERLLGQQIAHRAHPWSSCAASHTIAGGRGGGY